MTRLTDKHTGLPVAGTAVRVHRRFSEIGGTALANGIALQLFGSVIPLLLVGIAVVGFAAGDGAQLTGDVVDALGLPPGGDGAELLRDAIDKARQSKRTATAVGAAGLLWSGLAVVAALQRALDAVWQTEARGLRDKARALLWLAGSGAILAGSVALTGLLNVLPAWAAPVSVAAGLGVNVGVFCWTFTKLGRLPIGARALLPGAVVCAAGFEALKVAGSVYVPRVVANSSALYGSVGVVVALLAWFAIFGRLFVYGAIVNVLRWEAEHGTLTVPVEVPRVPGALAVHANRAGAVDDRL